MSASPSVAGPISRTALRRMLYAVLITDSQLNAFCIDFFPKVHREFTNGMDRTTKVNLLLLFVDQAEILRCLRSMYESECDTHFSSSAPDFVPPQDQQIDQQLALLYRDRAFLVNRSAAPGSLSALDERIKELRRRRRKGAQLSEGERLSGRYELLEQVGHGGFAEVWQAYDHERRHLVAVKILHGQHARDRSMRERFERGARRMATLQHQNVVRVLSVVEEDEGFAFFTMDYLSGGNLHQAVCAKRLTPELALRAVIEAGAALQQAHGQGWIHRDVKPHNILLDATGRAYLSDFDLVLGGDSTGGTRTGGMGTFVYAAPEQLADAGRVDARADVYSLAMTALFAIYGGDLPMLAFQHSAAFINTLSATGGLPRSIQGILRNALSWKPDDRPASAKILCTALLAASQSVTQFASLIPKGQTPTGAAGFLLRRRRALVALSVLTGGTAVSLLGEKAGWFTLQRVVIPSSEPVAPKNTFAAPKSPPPFRVGVLNSLSGTMAISARPIVEATLLAIEELNYAGGLLGRPIEPLQRDSKSLDEMFVHWAERLIIDENVVTVFGGSTSSSRRAIKEIVEKRDHLLIFPCRDEGLEDSPNIIYNGSTPNQLIIPAVHWALSKLGSKRLFIIGSDELLGRVSAEVIHDTLLHLDAKVVGTRFVLPAEIDFKPFVKKLIAAKADVLFNMVSGDSNVPLFRELRAAGITPATLPTISLGIGESELAQLSGVDMVNDYLSCSYFESLDRLQNKLFVERFKKKYGQYRSISDPMEAAYAGVYLWAQAVRSSGANNVGEIRRSMQNQSYEGPSSLIRIEPSNNHTWKMFRIGKIASPTSIEVVFSSESLLPPEPFPSTRTRATWEQTLDYFQKQWGGGWANPTFPNLLKNR